MILNCLLNSLRLNADIPLRGGGGTMLQKPLHQRNIEAVGLVYLRCIPLAEAVGTDALIAQIVAYTPKLLLYCPFCDRENQVIAPDAAAQAVILHVLLNHQRNCKDTPLPVGIAPAAILNRTHLLFVETVGSEAFFAFLEIRNLNFSQQKIGNSLR